MPRRAERETDQWWFSRITTGAPLSRPEHRARRLVVSSTRSVRTVEDMLEGIPLFPEQASNLAPEVDNLYFFVTAVTAFFALLVVFFVIVFAVKYRDRTGEKVGAPITGSIWLELGWSIVPFLVSMAIFAWATIVFFHLVRAPDQTLEIYSTGKRWMWRFQHIDGQSEINELHVPLGRPVKVTFTSEDVLHSLFIPAFRVKADVIPGRYNSLWFTATSRAVHLFCAEYCGTNHPA